MLNFYIRGQTFILVQRRLYWCYVDIHICQPGGGGGGSEPGKCSSNRDCPRCYPLINRFGHDTDLLLYSTGTTQFAQSMATVSVQVIGEFTELEEKPMCWTKYYPGQDNLNAGKMVVEEVVEEVEEEVEVGEVEGATEEEEGEVGMGGINFF